MKPILYHDLLKTVFDFAGFKDDDRKKFSDSCIITTDSTVTERRPWVADGSYEECCIVIDEGVFAAPTGMMVNDFMDKVRPYTKEYVVVWCSYPEHKMEIYFGNFKGMCTI